MTLEEKIDILKVKLNIHDVAETNLLYTLLIEANELILNKLYPYGTDEQYIPDRYNMLQIRLAVEIYNKQGAEGETSHNENGINRSYSTYYDTLKEVIPYGAIPK